MSSAPPEVVEKPGYAKNRGKPMEKPMEKTTVSVKGMEKVVENSMVCAPARHAFEEKTALSPHVRIVRRVYHSFSHTALFHAGRSFTTAFTTGLPRFFTQHDRLSHSLLRGCAAPLGT